MNTISKAVKEFVLIDEDKGILDFLTSILSDAGFKVLCFNNGLEAVHFINRNNHSLENTFIITEFELHPLGGLPLIAHLCQQRVKHRGTLVLSGREVAADVESLSDLFVSSCECALSFFSKPFKVNDFIELFLETTCFEDMG